MSDKLESNTLVVCCEHVFYKIRKIRDVVHVDEDWQFLCGYDDVKVDGIHLVCYEHLKEREPSLEQIEEIPEGYRAFKNASDLKWMIYKIID